MMFSFFWHIYLNKPTSKSPGQMRSNLILIKKLFSAYFGSYFMNMHHKKVILCPYFRFYQKKHFPKKNIILNCNDLILPKKMLKYQKRHPKKEFISSGEQKIVGVHKQLLSLLIKIYFRIIIFGYIFSQSRGQRCIFSIWPRLWLKIYPK